MNFLCVALLCEGSGKTYLMFKSLSRCFQGSFSVHLRYMLTIYRCAKMHGIPLHIHTRYVLGTCRGSMSS